MNQALYRKYRSKSFDEVIGQEHITRTLSNAIKSGRISHAYLFTGPRGVGKTSVARILAHEVNQLPYEGESIHLDIIEIDAASNRRIDEIRELRERVRIAPAAAKYKVYIIDEVHMLTREAFNALLKTLEEPPAHCIFILATTEAHKLPETIISRTQRFEFRPIDTPQAAKHLKSIAKKEKIDISQSALELLAEFGGGSFRDSIGYLDQLSGAGKEITDDDVRQMLGLPSQAAVDSVLAALRSGNAKGLLAAVGQIRGQGVSAAEIAVSISKALRQSLVDGQGSPADARLLKQLVDVKGHPQAFDYLEVALLESIADRPATLSEESPKQPEPPAAAKPGPSAGSRPKPSAEPSPRPPASNFSLDRWDEVVALVKQQAASLYTALRLAQPRLEDGVLVLAFQFPLHKKKFEQAKNKVLVAGIIEQLSGDKLRVDCVVDKGLPVIQPEEADDSGGSFNAITNIFGTAEVLES